MAPTFRRRDGAQAIPKNPFPRSTRIRSARGSATGGRSFTQAIRSSSPRAERHTPRHGRARRRLARRGVWALVRRRFVRSRWRERDRDVRSIQPSTQAVAPASARSRPELLRDAACGGQVYVGCTSITASVDLIDSRPTTRSSARSARRRRARACRSSPTLRERLRPAPSPMPMKRVEP